MDDLVTVIQARMTSNRLPGKVLAHIGDWVALSLMLARLRRSTMIGRIVIAIPDNEDNVSLRNFLRGLVDVDVVTGSEHNVLSRFVSVKKKFPAALYVRLTGDCPFICPEVLDDVVAMALRNNGCASNVDPPTFADGFDVECISGNALDWLDVNSMSVVEREHVTLGLRGPNSPFVFGNVCNLRGDHSAVRLTLDTPNDLDALNRISLFFGREGSVCASAGELEAAYTHLRLIEVNGNLRRVS